jgi:hypothetical protein
MSLDQQTDIDVKAAGDIGDYMRWLVDALGSLVVGRRDPEVALTLDDRRVR